MALDKAQWERARSSKNKYVATAAVDLQDSPGRMRVAVGPPPDEEEDDE